MFSADPVMLRARSEAAKAATFPTSSSVAARPSIVRRSRSSTIAARPSKSAGIVSGTPPVCRVSTRMPYGELAGQIPAQGLDGAERDLQPSEVGLRIAVAAEGENHP